MNTLPLYTVVWKDSVKLPYCTKLSRILGHNNCANSIDASWSFQIYSCHAKSLYTALWLPVRKVESIAYGSVGELKGDMDIWEILPTVEREAQKHNINKRQPMLWHCPLPPGGTLNVCVCSGQHRSFGGTHRTGQFLWYFYACRSCHSPAQAPTNVTVTFVREYTFGSQGQTWVSFAKKQSLEILSDFPYVSYLLGLLTLSRMEEFPRCPFLPFSSLTEP